MGENRENNRECLQIVNKTILEGWKKKYDVVWQNI